MTEEEIEKRIKICNERALGYREADQNRRAENYEEEIYKWVKLLSKLNPENYKLLQDYEQRCFDYEKILRNIKEDLEQEKVGDDINQKIIDKISKIFSSEKYESKRYVSGLESRDLNEC